MTDKPSITNATPRTTKSWIGQTVTLQCVANGFPTPTITWKKPDGSRIEKVGVQRNILDVQMKTDGGFGNYTCEATNAVGAAVPVTVQVKKISKLVGLPCRVTANAMNTTASLRPPSFDLKANVCSVFLSKILLTVRMCSTHPIRETLSVRC